MFSCCPSFPCVLFGYCCSMQSPDPLIFTKFARMCYLKTSVLPSFWLKVANSSEERQGWQAGGMYFISLWNEAPGGILQCALFVVDGTEVTESSFQMSSAKWIFNYRDGRMREGAFLPHFMVRMADGHAASGYSMLFSSCPMRRASCVMCQLCAQHKIIHFVWAFSITFITVVCGYLANIVFSQEQCGEGRAL